MFSNNSEKLQTENTSLKTQVASLQTQINLLQNAQAQADKRFLAGIGKIIVEGNPNFTSIMATLEPILKDQFDKQRLSDNTFITAFVSALQMAMQQAYTSRERERALDIQEQVQNKQLDNEYNIALQELGLKAKQLELQKLEIDANVKLKEAQIEQINQSIIDNRLIKSAEILAGIIGMAMSANMDVPKGLWVSVFDIVNTLLGKAYDKEGTMEIAKTGSSDKMGYAGKTYQYQGGVLVEFIEDRGSIITRPVPDGDPAREYFRKLTGL